VDTVSFTLLETEKQIDRALQQMGKDERALWKGSRMTEKISEYHSVAVRRWSAVADDDQ
jgi:hypothetical protein